MTQVLLDSPVLSDEPPRRNAKSKWSRCSERGLIALALPSLIWYLIFTVGPLFAMSPWRSRTGRAWPPRPTSTAPTTSYGVIGLYSLTLVLPLYWLLISAFKPRLETVTEPFIPTFSDGFTHFVKVWNLL